MSEPTERDREMAMRCVKRMHPIASPLNLDPQIEHVALYIAIAREEGRQEERERWETWPEVRQFVRWWQDRIRNGVAKRSDADG